MNELKLRRRTTWTGGSGSAFIGALVIVIAIGQGRAAADDGWVQSGGGDIISAVPERPDELTRLPPVKLASYDAEAAAESFTALEFYTGYDSGFVIANHDPASLSTASTPFLLRVNSWLQLRQTLFDAEDPSQDLNLFSIERLRLSLGGHAYSPNMKYFLQFDGNSDQAAGAIFLDYFLSYDLGREFLGFDANKLGVKAGMWKVPFSRSRQESGRRLAFVERSTANLFFDLNRSIGAGVFGELNSWATPLHFETAIFNGFQSGADTNIRDAGLDQNFAWSARMYTDLLGEFGNDGESDLTWQPAPAIRLGCGLAVTRVDAIGEGEFVRTRVVDSGSRLVSVLPPETTAYDIGMYTIDAHWKHRGLTVIAEYYWRYLANFQGGDVPNLSDSGFNFQLGQFVVPAKLELLARWSRLSGNSGALGAVYQSTDEVGVGAAWYLNGNNAKFVFDVSRENGMPLFSPRLDILPGAEGWLLRTQFQFGF